MKRLVAILLGATAAAAATACAAKVLDRGGSSGDAVPGSVGGSRAPEAERPVQPAGAAPSDPMTLQPSAPETVAVVGEEPVMRARAAVIQILWPPRLRVQAIPQSVAALTFKAFGPDSALVDEVTVQRPQGAATSSVTIPADPQKFLPVGTVRFDAVGKNAQGIVVASASATASIHSNHLTTLALTFAPVEPSVSSISTNSIITTLVGRGAKPAGASIGDGGAGYLAYVASPNDVAVARDGTVFVGDRINERIRSYADGIVGTVAGGGTIVATDSPVPAASASFRVGGGTGPGGLALTPAGDLAVIGGNAPGKKGLFLVPRSAGTRYGKVLEPGTVVPILTAAATPAPNPDAVAAGPEGTLYLADSGNLKVWAISPTGTLAEFAGNGTQIATESIADEGALPLAVGFGGMSSVSADRLGNVYISESNKLQRIRMVCMAAGTHFGREMAAGRIYTLLGRGTVTPFGSADVGDFGQASNPTGDPLEATLNGMRRAVFDPDGNLFFADSGNNRVRRIDRLTGVVTTVVGSGTRTLTDASNLGDDIKAGLATLSSPNGLAFDLEGNLLIGDTGNHRVRIVRP